MSNLLKLPYQGPQFTWTNNRESDELILERLDRAYASNSWCCLFPEARLWHYPVAVSDHAVIMLDASPARRRKRTPYRIDNWCLQHKDIEELVNTNWQLPFDLQRAANFNQLKNCLKREVEITHDYWLQRAKIRHAQEGHAPTKYLFQKARTQKNRNRIGALKDNEGYYTDFTLHLTVDQSQWLDRPFTAEEVRDAVFSIGDNKSPGIDGLTSAFFKRFWHTVEKHVTIAVLKFLNLGHILKEWNQTLITLVPKIANPETVSQLRPISLCNVLYKIASKCLAKRLRSLLPDIIPESQNAFIKGRLIYDNCLIAHEIMTYVNQQTSGTNCYMAMKVDMNKAFGRVSWHFLLYLLLQRHGFSLKWQQLIMEAVTTYSPNAPPDFKQYLSKLLTMQYKDNFGVYLGVPADIGHNKLAPFGYLLDKGVTAKIEAAILAFWWAFSALLAKNYHRIMNNPQLLLSKVFKAKYSKDCGAIPPLKSNHYRLSWGWKSILKAAHKLQDGFAWKLVNGIKINLLSDP
ncbi:uncharacterized protein LOC141641309 [Silene latifolia]|uniref:uncharacterized protein LOC141641309 n=1 Tax=Silene latifolia TaxID=37657 RepID=UPI003D78A0AA